MEKTEIRHLKTNCGSGRKCIRSGCEKGSTKRYQAIAEFFPVKSSESSQRKKQEIFSSKGLDGKVHPYREGLRDELKRHAGIYIFFDSRGRAIYAGKAGNNLWGEMKSAFNRARGDVQSIRRVKHPEKKVKYRTSEEKTRQIRELPVPLHDLAAYFSAYEVPPGLIGKMEAMLVRSFANDLLNARMEKFEQRSGSKKK